MAVLSQKLLAERVRQAADEAGIRQGQLASLIGMDPSALSRALNGQRQFKTLEVALIAEHLKVSVQSLLSVEDEANRSALISARASTDTNPAVERAISITNEMLDLNALLAELGYPPHCELERPAVHLDLPYLEGQELARVFRDQIGIGDGDLPGELDDLASFVENRCGIDVAFECLPEGLDGLSVACGRFKLALISSRVSGTRQRYTLAHEIGHLVAGDSENVLLDVSVFGKKTPQEERANAFAAAFLMPASSLVDAVPRGHVTEEVVAELLGRYRVSLDALAFRMHNVGIVKAAGRDRIRAMASSRIALRSGRAADLQARNDRRIPLSLLNRSIEAYVEGKISIRPISELLKTDANLLLEELSPSFRIAHVEEGGVEEAVPSL